MPTLREEWCCQELKNTEESIAHRPMEEEFLFYEAVSSGNLDYVQQNCRQKRFTDPKGMGVLSTNSLTNIKYHFIVATAMITRQCVEHGMEVEQMALDFTGKMSLLKKNTVISKSITICMDYIYNNINQRITVSDLADYTGLSPSYLSRLFKKELGISISDYICEKKIEKAENLLKYSDFSFVEIANYLAFSSQSHFIQSFKKSVGLTPKKYRDKYYHASWEIKAPPRPKEGTV